MTDTAAASTAPMPTGTQAPAPAAAAGTAPVPGAPAGQQPAPASASLYVGDLVPSVTEANLFEKFNAVGQVASIRVCRDAITRRSLGYAYVNFVNPADAERALDSMNYDVIQGNPCRIMWSQRDPSMRRSGVGNIFIKNLHKKVGNKELYDTFSAFGNILSCKVVVDSNGESRGFGFVHYETQKAADTAIEKVNGMLLAEQQVYVGLFKSKADRVDEMGKSEKDFTNLFIKNFSTDVSEEKLEELFAKYGKITSRKIMIDGEGKSKGFGFVAFEDPEAARAAVEALNDNSVENYTDGENKLYVGRAQKKAERLQALRQTFEKRRAENQNRYKGVNLYVKNLDDTITDDQLREAFQEFGTITSAKVMTDDKSGAKGFGFVCFTSQDEATKAVTEMNGKILVSKPLYVALAQRKDERKQQLAMQHNQRLQSMRMQQGMYQQPGMPQMYLPQVMPQVPQARGYYQPNQIRPRFLPQQQQMMAVQQGQFRGMQQPMGVQGGMPGQRMPGGGNPRGQPRQAKGGARGQQQNAQFRQGQQRQAPIQQQVPAQALHQPGQEPLTASALASATNEQQKQMLGERLFPLIQKSHEALAGKITGMLLEMDNSELLHLLEDQNALVLKVDEAVKVLEEHARSAGPQ